VARQAETVAARYAKHNITYLSVKGKRGELSEKIKAKEEKKYCNK
jgi:hypothetical protein